MLTRISTDLSSCRQNYEELSNLNQSLLKNWDCETLDIRNENTELKEQVERQIKIRGKLNDKIKEQQEVMNALKRTANERQRQGRTLFRNDI